MRRKKYVKGVTLKGEGVQKEKPYLKRRTRKTVDLIHFYLTVRLQETPHGLG
jgi:hypothetical protein